MCVLTSRFANLWFKINPFKPEFTVVIFIHYKPRIAAAILDLQWMKMIWCGLKIKVNHHVLVNQFHGNFRSKTLCFRKIKSVFRDVKRCFNASCGLKGLQIWLIFTHLKTQVGEHLNKELNGERVNPYKAEIFLYKPRGQKYFLI